MATSKKKKVVKKVSKKKTTSATAPIKKSVSVNTPKNELVKNISQTSNKKIETKTNAETPFTRNRILILLLLAFVIIGLGVWTSIKSPKDLLKLSKPFPDEKPPETILTPSVNQAIPTQPASNQDSTNSDKKVLQPTEKGKPTTKAPLPIPLEVAAEYKVLPGDTYKKIAKKTLGDKKRYNEIMQINNFSSPNDLKIGDTIKIPVK